MLSLLAMVACTTQVQAQSLNQLFYVSPTGSGEGGRSWKAAFTDLSKIRWDKVQPGDTIFIDGGKESITYKSPLQVGKSGTKAARISIRQSAESGRDGNIIIRGPNVGITIQNQSYVSVQGTRSSGIIVESCSDTGVSVYGNVSKGPSVSNLLENIEVRNCGRDDRPGAGISFSGQQLTLNRVIAHDNYRSNVKALFPQSDDASGLLLKSCWIYNNKVTSDGVSLERGINLAGPKVNLFDCILGPGLANGAKLDGLSALFANGVLFINGRGSNLKAVGSNWIDLRNTTSFMTRLNSEGKSHSFIDAPGPSGRVAINSSVVYGGAVLLKPGRVGSGNTQFRTTGNTAAISDRMVDPRFWTNVGAYPNTVSNRTLIDTDYALSLGSPAAGTGARITSVKQLLISR